MAIYGTLLKTQDSLHENVSFEQMIDFIYESDNEMNLLFEGYNVINILKEENTSLIIPKDMNETFTNDPEKVTKKFSERIKEMFNKFLDFVKTTFENVKKKIIEFYLEHNFQDNILSKYKDKVTWGNLEKAKKNGWKGISKTLPSVTKLVSINDTLVGKELVDNFKALNLAINKLESCKDENDLSNTEQQVKEQMDTIKKYVNPLKSEKDRMISSNKMGIMFGEDIPYFAYYTDTNAPDGYYYPTTQAFAVHKNLAENGQKEIKNMKITGNASIKLIKDVTLHNEKEILDMNKKSFAKDKQDFENKLIFCVSKYKYQSTSLYIKACSKSLNGLLSILAKSHSIAIQNYIQYASAIKKYCTV